MTEFLLSRNLDRKPRVLTVIGAFDTPAIAEFESRIDEVVEQADTGGSLCVVLDFSQATFIHTVALARLQDAVKRLQRLGGGLMLCGANQFAQGIFRTLGLDRTIRLCASEDEAIAELAKPAPAPQPAGDSEHERRMARFQRGGGW